MGAKNSLLSNSAVCAQEILIKTSHYKGADSISTIPLQAMQIINSLGTHKMRLPQENWPVLQDLVFPLQKYRTFFQLVLSVPSFGESYVDNQLS